MLENGGLGGLDEFIYMILSMISGWAFMFVLILINFYVYKKINQKLFAIWWLISLIVFIIHLVIL